MIIAFATEDKKGLDSMISSHFGKAPYYIFVKVEEGEIKEIIERESPFLTGHSPGEVPEFVHRNGAAVIISGGMGHRAIQNFEDLKITPVVGVSGIVKDVLYDFLSGKLKDYKGSPCNEGCGEK